MKLLQFSIHNFQFSLNYQFSITNEAAICKMLDEKLMVNAKCEMANTAGGGV